MLAHPAALCAMLAPPSLVMQQHGGRRQAEGPRRQELGPAGGRGMWFLFKRTVIQKPGAAAARTGTCTWAGNVPSCSDVLLVGSSWQAGLSGPQAFASTVPATTLTPALQIACAEKCCTPVTHHLMVGRLPQRATPPLLKEMLLALGSPLLTVSACWAPSSHHCSTPRCPCSRRCC